MTQSSWLVVLEERADLTGLRFSWRLLGRTASLPFPVSRGAWNPLAPDPASVCFSDWPSCPSFTRTLWWRCVRPNDPGSSPRLKVIDAPTSAKAPFPLKETYPEVLGIGLCTCLGGPSDSLPQRPWKKETDGQVGMKAPLRGNSHKVTFQPALWGAAGPHLELRHVVFFLSHFCPFDYK